MPESIVYGEELDISFEAKEGYSLPQNIVITMGGQTLTADDDYLWIDGELFIESVTGKVNISINGIGDDDPIHDFQNLNTNIELMFNGTKIGDDEYTFGNIQLRFGLSGFDFDYVYKDIAEAYKDSTIQYGMELTYNGLTKSVNLVPKLGSTGYMEFAKVLKNCPYEAVVTARAFVIIDGTSY